MRFTSRWARATIAPPTSVRAASAQMTGCQSPRNVGNVATKTRRKAANPPALASAAMNPVTGVGAPW